MRTLFKRRLAYNRNLKQRVKLAKFVDGHRQVVLLLSPRTTLVVRGTDSGTNLRDTHKVMC